METVIEKAGLQIHRNIKRHCLLFDPTRKPLDDFFVANVEVEQQG